MEPSSIFDTIEVKKDSKLKESYYGIIDYVNTRFVQFYDFTDIDDHDLVTMVIAWRASGTSKRFSLYALDNFPSIELPAVKVMNRRFVSEKYAGFRVDLHAPTVRRRKVRM